HYNTNAASPANIGSNIKFTGDAVGAKIFFDSFDPSQYRVAYALDNQIDNGLPNAVSFKNAEIKFSISDFKNSSGRTKYIFANSILDLRQISISTPAAPRNFLFPSIEVAASSLSMSVFYSSGAFSADTLSANSAQGKLFLSDISFFGNAQRGDEGFVKVFSGGLQFEENAIAEKSIGKYVYSVESSSWSGSYFDLGYYYLNVRVSMLDFLFRSNAQSGVRIFDFSVSDIKEYGFPYYISRSLDGMANGKFTIKGDAGFLRDSPQNSISGFIIDGAGQKGSLFKISGASAFLEMENINISDAAGENGSALNIENARSTAAFLKNVLMKNNSAQQGGAVYIYKSAAIMEDISFIGNSASQKGGAIYIGGELGASAFLTLRAFKEDIVFHSNKVLSKDNDMRLEKYSRLILDADGADIKMDGSIDGGAVENYILKTGAKTLTLGGNTDFGGTFEIVSGKLVFDKNSFVRISTLSVGGSSILPFASKSAAKAVSAETEVLTSSLTISNLTINADGKFSMSDIVSRHITYLDNVKIAGILEIGFDLSGENGIADRFYAGSINIIDGAQLIVKGYGIGTSSDVVFKGSLAGSMWNRGGISGAVSAGEYEIFYEPSEGAYFIKTMVSQNFSALEGLSDNQKNVSDFLSSVPNSDVAVQKIINPLTKMQDAVNINKGLNQLIGLIYADVLSAGTRGGIYEIIYSNIKTPAYFEKAVERTEYKKKEKNRYQLFDDKELEKLGILASIDIDESAVAQSNKDKKTDKTSLEAKANKNLWFNIGGSDGFLRSKESDLELKNRSISFAAGSDIFNTRIKSAGLFISYEAQNAETDLEKADIADIRFGSYFSFTPSNNLSIKADLGFGIEGFDIERIVDYGVNYGGETLKAQSQFYGYSLAGGLEAQIASFAKGRIKPFLDLRLGFSATPEVIEENAKYANLTIDPAYHLMAKPSAGLKSAFSIGDALISLKVALSYLAAGEKEAQIYFKELKDFGSFSVKGIEEEKISGSAGAGFQYNFGKDAALSLNANALFSDNSILYSFFGGFSFAW
ncbi:MAG: autotransporter domain-containing protein, partial [Elusimicrobiota bacterium]|nr:autotransporter domain-containing protein [Elusimicrobiota bacterium]